MLLYMQFMHVIEVLHMRTNHNNTFTSDFTISNDVIATIATNAAMEVPGVAGLETTPVDLYTATNALKEQQQFCKVTRSDYDIKIHLYLNFLSDAKIQTVASEVQTKVKEAIQNIAGTLVTRVDISVTGITEETPQEKETEPET